MPWPDSLPSEKSIETTCAGWSDQAQISTMLCRIRRKGETNIYK